MRFQNLVFHCKGRTEIGAKRPMRRIFGLSKISGNRGKEKFALWA